jgi:hypothetical protein
MGVSGEGADERRGDEALQQSAASSYSIRKEGEQ